MRKRSKEEERQIVEESLESGVTVVSVAGKYGVRPVQLQQRRDSAPDLDCERHWGRAGVWAVVFVGAFAAGPVYVGKLWDGDPAEHAVATGGIVAVLDGIPRQFARIEEGDHAVWGDGGVGVCGENPIWGADADGGELPDSERAGRAGGKDIHAVS